MRRERSLLVMSDREHAEQAIQERSTSEFISSYPTINVMPKRDHPNVVPPNGPVTVVNTHCGANSSFW